MVLPSLGFAAFFLEDSFCKYGKGFKLLTLWKIIWTNKKYIDSNWCNLQDIYIYIGAVYINLSTTQIQNVVKICPPGPEETLWDVYKTTRKRSCLLWLKVGGEGKLRSKLGKIVVSCETVLFCLCCKNKVCSVVWRGSPPGWPRRWPCWL